MITFFQRTQLRLQRRRRIQRVLRAMAKTGQLGEQHLQVFQGLYFILQILHNLLSDLPRTWTRITTEKNMQRSCERRTDLFPTKSFQAQTDQRVPHDLDQYSSRKIPLVWTNSWIVQREPGEPNFLTKLLFILKFIVVSIK